MSKFTKIGIVVAVVLAAGVVLVLKQVYTAPAAGPADSQGGGAEAPRPTAGPADSQGDGASAPRPAAAVPRLVDLGADKCIPCKMMAPELAALKRDYAGKLQVDVYDVWKNPGIGNSFGIRIIPTQIFFDANGRERFRHEGFMSKEDMLAKFRELGVPLEPSAP